LRTAKYLKSGGSADGAIVSFTRDVQRIAHVQQFGLRDKVNKKSGHKIDYSMSQLLGLMVC
jgi:hypothetical protein